MDRRILAVSRRNLDTAARVLAKAGPPPPSGWIGGVRSVLGMPGSTLSSRLGVSQQAVRQLEASEREQRITLRKLNDAAQALGCRLVYGFVPLAGTFDDILRLRAREVAVRMVATTERTMSLEAQGVDAVEREARVNELAEDLYRQPSRIWSER